MFKRVGPARLTFVQNGTADIDIQIRFGQNNEWQGVAKFPAEMADEAMNWIEMVETPNDLENLIREFCTSQAWESYQEFRAINGF